MRFRLHLLASLALAAPAIATAQNSGPLGPGSQLAGPRSQVLTLGTLHLSQQP